MINNKSEFAIYLEKNFTKEEIISIEKFILRHSMWDENEKIEFCEKIKEVGMSTAMIIFEGDDQDYEEENMIEEYYN